MNTTKPWNIIATTCLLSGALMLTGCGSSSDDNGGNGVVGEGGMLEFTSQPVSTADALKGSNSNPFDVTAKDSSGNTVDYDGKVKLEILNKESNTATELGIFDMTDGLLDDQVVPLTGANGNTVLTATLVNSDGENQSNVFESNAFNLIEESSLTLKIHSIGSHDPNSDLGFDATVHFTTTTGTTPVHVGDSNVTVSTVTVPSNVDGPGSLVNNPDKPLTIPAVNGVATFIDRRCTITGDYTFKFTSPVNGNIETAPSTTVFLNYGG